jgi:hypothetical protein
MMAAVKRNAMAKYDWDRLGHGDYFEYPARDHTKVVKAALQVSERRSRFRFVAVRWLWRCYAVAKTTYAQKSA